MTFPFIHDSSWSTPIWQGIYGSSVVAIAQLILVATINFIKPKIKSASKDFGAWYIGITAIPLIVLLIITFFSSVVTIVHIISITISSFILLLLLSRYIFKLEKKSNYLDSLLDRLHSAGVHDAVIDPTLNDYSVLLKRTVQGFSFLGVGADKLTRNFDIFREAMNRCSSNNNPARLLLVAPDVDWVYEGATRRGLGKSHFKELLIRSLKKIKRFREDYQTPIEVRFYRAKPVFRILLVNNDECWFGYYSESVINTDQNEFENKSHTTLIVRKPSDIPPDREFYGAIEEYFNQLWNQAETETWDFEKYLN